MRYKTGHDLKTMDMKPSLFENNRQEEEMWRAADIGRMFVCDINEMKSGHIPFSDIFRRSGACYYIHQTFTNFHTTAHSKFMKIIN